MLRKPKRKGECRFCLEEDRITQLLSPCICSGTGKYVHAACLMKWYALQPERGLECSVCKTRLATRRYDQIEQIPTQEEIQWWCVSVPLFNLIFLHFLVGFVNLLLLSNGTQLQFIFPVYYCIQAMTHIFYGAKLYSALDHVKQPQKYITLWCRPHRLGLIGAHIGFVCGIPYTATLTGMAADICLVTYFYEHIEVLKELNEDAQIEFCSLTPSSSE
jgi:hypothetical protein